MSRRLANPATIAFKLNGGDEVKTMPTFSHEVGGIRFEDVPVVLRCSQSGRYNPVAVVVKDDNGDGVYVKDNTYVGNDKTAKSTGLYRIDKQADKENQRAWRAEQKRLIEEAQAIIDAAADVVEDDNDEEVEAA